MNLGTVGRFLGLGSQSGSPAASSSPPVPAPAQTPASAQVRQIRGGQYPLPEDPPSRKTEYIDALLREGESDALARYRQATKNLLYANGRQWIDWVVNRRTWEDLPNASNDLRATMNYVRPILRSRAARMIPSAIHFVGVPDSNSFEARDRTNVATNLIQARWKMLDMDSKLRYAATLAFSCGFAAVKSFWNPRIGTPKPATLKLPMQGQFDPMTGQPTIEYQDVPVDRDGNPVDDISQAYYYRPGDTDAAIRSVFNIRLNPEAHGWTAAEGLRWLIDTEVVPIDVAREKFPEIADQIQPLDGLEQFLTYERIAAGGNTIRGRGAHTVPGRGGPGSQTRELTAIREYWELPCSYYPDGRLIVSVGGAVPYDDVFPQGIFPYDPIFDELGLLSGYGRPCVNDLISPQDVINREWTAIVREMAQAGSGQFVAWNVPGLPDQLTSAERAVIRVPMNSYLANRSIGDVFQRLTPPQVAGDRWRMIEQAKIAMFDIGAYHEVSRGQIPPGIDSGVAIEQLQESEAGQLKDASEALRRSLVGIARKQLAIAKWGYGEEEERAIPVDRPDLKVLIETVRGDMLPEPESIGIEVENFRPYSEAARRAEIKELGGMGWIDPRNGMKAMDLGRGIDSMYESQTRDYARAKKENLDFLKGEVLVVPQGIQVDPQTGAAQEAPPAILHTDLSPFLFPQDDDHQIHIECHYEVAKDDNVPWPVRQLVLGHIEEHRMALQQMAMLQMAMAGAGQQEPEGDEGNKQSKPKGEKK